MFFVPSLIRKIYKVTRIALTVLVLGVLTCHVVGCAPAINQAGEKVQTSNIERMDVIVENGSFDEYAIYIMWEGHVPTRIGRVESASTTVIKGILSHTKNVYFVVRRFPGREEYRIGPLMVFGAIDVLLILKNSMTQSMIVPLSKS